MCLYNPIEPITSYLFSFFSWYITPGIAQSQSPVLVRHTSPMFIVIVLFQPSSRQPIAYYGMPTKHPAFRLFCAHARTGISCDFLRHVSVMCFINITISMQTAFTFQIGILTLFYGNSSCYCSPYCKECLPLPAHLSDSSGNNPTYL